MNKSYVAMGRYRFKLKLCGVQQCGSRQQRRRLLRRQLGEGGAGENRFDDYIVSQLGEKKKSYCHVMTLRG